MKIVRLHIAGLVQGVGYRAFLQSQASGLAVEGWVRNRRDRWVEALIAGPAEAVGEMVVAARRGPPESRVEDIQIVEAEPSALAEVRRGHFSVLPTV